MTGVQTSKSNRAWPRRLALSDPTRAPDPSLLLPRLAAGSGLIWRAYDKTPSRQALRAMDARATQKHVTLFIAVSPKATRMTKFHHLHLAEHHLKTPYTDGRFARPRRAAPHLRVVAAAHSMRAIIAAARAGVDAVMISPVFTTASHPDGQTLGPIRFAMLASAAQNLGLKVYALGGIVDATKVRRLKGSTATGIAGIGLFTKRA